jgi:FtsP/CotA-like multicopper oxidase with cupredoxin domain
LTPGKRHLLRLINPSVENTYTVSLVDHQFTVIANDFVPVDSNTQSSLYLAVGQRYDVTIDASQAVGNYWFNVTYSGTGVCGASVNPHPAAIFSYEGAPNALPATVGPTPPDSLCADTVNYTPVVTRTAPIASFTPTSNNLDVTFVVNDAISQVNWEVNGSAIDVQWDKPTLEYVLEGNTSYPRSENVVSVPNSNAVGPSRYLCKQGLTVQCSGVSGSSKTMPLFRFVLLPPR